MKETSLRTSFINKLYQNHQQAVLFPKPQMIHDWVAKLIAFLFPELTGERCISEESLKVNLTLLEAELIQLLTKIDHLNVEECEDIAVKFFNCLESVHSSLQEDVEAIDNGDPACRGSLEVILTYPGFYAIAFYRIAHRLFNLGVPLVPRIITEYASTKTGIEIHPGAKIGRRFCIDHGSGVVIGETCIIGDDVKIYQGVTLGALSVAKEMADTKRHPTIEDNVVIYSGATILGGETVVGAQSIIGGNVWLTKSVPVNSLVYHQSKVTVRNQDSITKEV